jgi:hypothetical protein
MIRRIVTMHSSATDFLREGERLTSQLDDDGLGVWVGIYGRNPELSLRRVQRAAFSTFELPGVRTDQNGWGWTHFRIC